jgi:hypothetical protein
LAAAVAFGALILGGHRGEEPTDRRRSFFDESTD